jgi:hypothetical protein
MRLPAVSGKAYSFRHALIQDAAYQSLLLARRRQHHAAIGQALVDQFPEWASAQPEVVAQHLTAAGLVDPAIGAWQRAAETAIRRGAYVEALTQLSHGLDLIERLPADDCARAPRALPLLLMRGRIETRRMQTQALSTYRESLDKARRHGLTTEFAEAAMGFGEAQMYVHLPTKEAIALIEEALRAVGPEEALLKCRLLVRLGRAILLIGESDRATTVNREARTMAERLADKRCSPTPWPTSSSYHHHHGDLNLTNGANSSGNIVNSGSGMGRRRFARIGRSESLEIGELVVRGNTSTP